MSAAKGSSTSEEVYNPAFESWLCFVHGLKIELSVLCEFRHQAKRNGALGEELLVFLQGKVFHKARPY